MPETLSGQIERVTFHNPENGFAVLKAKVKGRRDLATVVGNVTSVTAGEHLEAAKIVEMWGKARAPRASTPDEGTSWAMLLTMETTIRPRQQKNVKKSSLAGHWARGRCYNTHRHRAWAGSRFNVNGQCRVTKGA